MTPEDPIRRSAWELPRLGPGSERFVAVRILARGGCATVLLAEDRETGAHVAIKVLDADPRARAALRDRFLSEIEVLSRLEHPGIVEIVAHGRTPTGQPWFAMPFYDAGSLDDLLMRHGALAPKRVARFGLEILDALAYAHRRGVVHRDIKAGNILLDHADVAVLCDFGIAADLDNRMTRVGAQLGTPVYAAPEQLADPRLAEPRSDLYASGVTLYAAVTAESPARLVYAHTRDAALERVPAALRPVIARATEPAVNRRFESATEMAAVLAEAL